MIMKNTLKHLVQQVANGNSSLYSALSEETKKLEAISDQKINDLEELKKSVLQKAFAGQLIMNNEQKGIKHTS